jgi:hypothetical protein
MGGKREEMTGFEVNQTRSKPLRRVTPGAAAGNPGKDELAASWGQPDRRRSEDGGEVWVYDAGLAWRGAVPMIGIGIPLVAPVGRNSYDFHFPQASQRAGKLVATSNEMSGGYFGPGAFSNRAGFGFNDLGAD